MILSLFLKFVLFKKALITKNGYKNAEFDRLFEAAMTMTSEKSAVRKLREIKRDSSTRIFSVSHFSI